MSIHTAAKDGNLNEVRRLLDAGANIEEKKFEDGYTPLHTAIEARQEPIVQLLLERGANIEAIDSRGETPLMVATAFGTVPIMQRLIDAGANVNAVSHFGNTPLLSAIYRNNEPAIRLLVNNNADMNIETTIGHTPLISAIENGNTAIVRFLLDSGASVTSPFKLESPLHAAVKSGDEELVRMILKKGADYQAKNHFGQKPIDLPHITPSMRALLKRAETQARAQAVTTALTVTPISGLIAGLTGKQPANGNNRHLDPGLPREFAKYFHKKQGGRKTRRKRAYKLSRKRQWRGL